MERPRSYELTERDEERDEMLDHSQINLFEKDDEDGLYSNNPKKYAEMKVS